MGTQCVVDRAQRAAVWLNVIYLVPLSEYSFVNEIGRQLMSACSVPLCRVLLQELQEGSGGQGQGRKSRERQGAIDRARRRRCAGHGVYSRAGDGVYSEEEV